MSEKLAYFGEVSSTHLFKLSMGEIKMNKTKFMNKLLIVLLISFNGTLAFSQVYTEEQREKHRERYVSDLALYEKGDSLLQIHQYEKAIYYYSKISLLDKTDISLFALMKLTTCRIQLGHYSDCLFLCNKIISEYEPDSSKIIPVIFNSIFLKEFAGLAFEDAYLKKGLCLISYGENKEACRTWALYISARESEKIAKQLAKNCN